MVATGDRRPNHRRIWGRVLDASDWNCSTDLQQVLSLHLRPGTNLRLVDVRASALGLGNGNLFGLATGVLGLTIGTVVRTAETSRHNQHNNDRPQTDRHKSPPPKNLVHELA
jgi:hypothetical protein